MDEATAKGAGGKHDLGEPSMQATTRLALTEDCTRFILRHKDDEVLVSPSLMMDCRLALEDVQAARPASFSSFMRAMVTPTRSCAHGA